MHKGLDAQIDLIRELYSPWRDTSELFTSKYISWLEGSFI